MLRALATDFASIPGVRVRVLADHRGFPAALPNCELISVMCAADERMLLSQSAAESDWTVVVAPETDRVLFDRCDWVEACGGRLLGATSALVELLADKHRTAEHLAAHHVRCPSGIGWRPGRFDVTVSSPLVIKPLDGAGAEATYLVKEKSELDELLIDLRNRHGPDRAWRIETFEAGMAVSVSELCGPAGRLAYKWRDGSCPA